MEVASLAKVILVVVYLISLNSRIDSIIIGTK